MSAHNNIYTLILLLCLVSCNRAEPVFPVPTAKLLADTIDCVSSVPTFPFSIEEVRRDNGPGIELVNYEKCLWELADMDTFQRSFVSLEVDKRVYALTVIYDGKLLKRYPVVFGGNPRQDKLQQGDGRTPEGHFQIKAKYQHNTWDKFMWINYPTAESYRKHAAAKKKKLIADFVQIGGEIGIHGVPEDMDFWIDIRKNWTAGCISLKNSDVRELYRMIEVGTPILVRK